MLVTIGAHGVERDGSMILVWPIITRVAVGASTILCAVSVKRGRKVLRVTNRAVQGRMAPDQFWVVMSGIGSWGPAGCLVTRIALKCNPGVICRFSGCRLSVVTIGTLAGGTGVMNKPGRNPSRRFMTSVALRRGDNMVLRFARGRLSIVTGGALPSGAGIMNKACGNPSPRPMTGVALGRGHKMVLRFTRSLLSIVTRGALPNGAGIMNIAGGNPCGCLVTGVALGRCRDMVLRLARSGLSVVTRGALAGYQCQIMIKGCR